MESSKFKSCVIIGRRRIGKTSLINEFIKNRENIFFQFANSSEEVNLEIVSGVMSAHLEKKLKYNGFTEFFDDLSLLAKQKRMIFVFDEYQFVSTRCPDFAGITQVFLDRDIGNSFLIISGSSVGMLEAELKYNRPLYGRARKIKIDPMNFRECCEFHENFSDLDQLKLYLTVGGVPFYYDETPAKSYDDYLEKYFLGSKSIFVDEGENIINRELTPNTEYFAILDSIASGRFTVNDISVFSKLDRKICERRIKTMEEIGFIGIETPMAGAPLKPIRYVICDCFLSFYFHVLRKFTIATEITDTLRQAITSFHGRMFEQFCVNYIKNNYQVEKIGKWWGKVEEVNEIGKTEVYYTDIDIVADVLSGKIKKELFVECKFKNSKVGFSTLEELEVKIEHTKHGKNIVKMIIAREFGDDFISYCEENNVLLIDLDTLMERKGASML